MKKNILFTTFCLIGCLCAFSEVQFSRIRNTQQEIPAPVKDKLEVKLTQILTRCSAAASGEENTPYGVEPLLNILEEQTVVTGGQKMTVVRAEFVLVAKNLSNGSAYHNVTIPLKSTVRGSDVLNTLLNAIRIDHPQYVRFVRVAREKIAAATPVQPAVASDSLPPCNDSVQPPVSQPVPQL